MINIILPHYGACIQSSLFSNRKGNIHRVLSGSFSLIEAEDIINKPDTGCLPAGLIEKPVEVKTIGEKVGL